MLALDRLVRLIPHPAYFFDVRTLEILVVNPEFAKLMEYDEAALRNMTIADLRPSEEFPNIEKALEPPDTDGAVEWRYTTATGQLAYVHLTYRDSVFVDSTGKNRNVRLVTISRWDTPVEGSAQGGNDS
jgi:PAS domain-containing protein